MPTLALTMIVKNAAHLLPRIREGLLAFDQVVIADTGSSDSTVAELNDIFKDAPEKLTLIEHVWEDDFASARNATLRHINTDWWMWLDSDDVFTEEDVKGWRGLLRKGEILPKVSHLILPYWYAVDDEGNPLLVQMRERILRTNVDGWEWRERIHEVCCTIGPLENSTHLTIQSNPVVHRPDRGAYADYNRNWRILHKILDNPRGASLARLWYYIQIEALNRGMLEYAYLAGRNALDSGLSDYMAFECTMRNADIQNRMSLVGDKEYHAELRDAHYQEAIRQWPTRNEARLALIRQYLAAHDFSRAEHVVATLSTDFPDTYGAFNPADYVGVRETWWGLLACHYGDVEMALIWYSRAVEIIGDSAHIPDELKALDESIRALLDQQHATVWADDMSDTEKSAEMGNIARRVRKLGIVRRVYMIDSPHVANFAREVYVAHFADATQYDYDDTHPQVRKYAMTPTPNPSYEHDLTTLILDIPVHRVIPAKEAQEMVLSCDPTSVVVYVSDEDYIPSGAVSPYEIEDDIIYAYENHLVAKAETLQRLIYRDGVWWYRIGDVMIDGASKLLRATSPNEHTVAFFAGGLESWDGTTPWRYGIGASETSVIYVAEAFARRGYDVTVFNTVPTERVVAGVRYRPLSHYRPGKPYSLAVVSRDVNMARVRHGKRQLFWAHDVIDAYSFANTVIDGIVCVSDWQQAEYNNRGYSIPSFVIPNPTPVAYEYSRDDDAEKVATWISQPERGLDAWYAHCEALNVTPKYIAYGFYNWRVSNNTQEGFKKVIRWKAQARKHGAMILGRVPLQVLRQVLQNSTHWIYRTTFPETFCVAALEAVNAGLEVHVNEDSPGALNETLSWARPNASTPDLVIIEWLKLMS